MKERSVDEIERWLVGVMASRVGVREASIDPERPFADYGLKSADAVAVAAELELWLGGPVSPALLYDHRCPHDLAAFLAPLAGASSAAAPSPAPLPFTARPEPIAIVGMACRVPGARGLAELWRLLADGVDAITEVPAERWPLERYYDPELSHPNAMNTKWGGFIGDVAGFDSDYFGVLPLEADSMDPQQRLLLELAAEAFEDAGVEPLALRASRTGVFVGISGNDYERRHRGRPVGADLFFATSNALSIAANRLSYVFDLRGPSVAIDTACSSSLVAVHQACASLQSGECNVALVGGVNLILSPDITISFSQAGATSRDGRCRAFDAGASGIVRGEGAAVVVLKPLSQALADRDRVHALILGSAVNQDGRTNGLSAPNGVAQRAVLKEAYTRAGVAPQDAQYVEAHGTGTKLGDPIEAAALGDVLGQGRPSGDRLAIGSVKSNIGHLEAAAGVVSLVKVALSLAERSLPPSLHFERPNPHIDLAALGLHVQTALGPWPRGANGRVAGVSAFGFGGTNAHVVLKEAPSVRRASTEERRGVALLSGKTLVALRQRAAELAAYCEADKTSSALDVAYTLARRAQLPVRAALPFGSRAELLDGLRALATGSAPAAVHCRQIVFVFSGHGTHWIGMARELSAALPLFRDQLLACSHELARHSTWNVWEELQQGEETSRIGVDLELTQLATFAVQVALAATWKALGVVPAAVVGHSVGEVAAAYAAEILTLEDAARVVCRRSQLLAGGIASSPPGGMALVRLTPEEAAAALVGWEAQVSLAAHNAPKSVVLSGDKAALETIVQGLRARRVAVRLVNAPGAGHSPAVEPAVPVLIEKLAGLRPSASTVPFFSSVTGALTAGGELGPEYWGANLRRPVQFVAAIEAIGSQLSRAVWLEISAHPTLGASVEQTLRRAGRRDSVVASLKREQEVGAWLEALGSLFEAGLSIVVAPWFERSGGRLVGLPTYPWQRQRHWLETVDVTQVARPSELEGRRGELGRRLDLPSPGGPALWADVCLDPRRELAWFELAGRRLASVSTLLGVVAQGYRQYRSRELQRISGAQARLPLYLDGASTRLSLLLWESKVGSCRFELSYQQDEAGNGGASLLSGEIEPPASGADPIAEVAPEAPSGGGAVCESAVACGGLGFALRHVTRGAGLLHLAYELHVGVALSVAVGAELCAHALLQLEPSQALTGWDVLELQAGSDSGDGRVHVSVLGENAPARIEARSTQGHLLFCMEAPRCMVVEAPANTAAAPASVTARAVEVEARLIARIAEVLGVHGTSIEATEPLSHLGIDSVTAIQLKNDLERELGISLPLAKLLEAPTIRELSVWAAHSIQVTTPAPLVGPVTASAELDLMLAGIEQLPPAELDALLGALLPDSE